MNWTDLFDRASQPMTAAAGGGASAPPVDLMKILGPLIETALTVLLPLLIGVGLLKLAIEAVTGKPVKGGLRKRRRRRSWFNRPLFRHNDSQPGYTTTELFTPTERAFLAALEVAVGQDYWIFGKVRIADVLTPRAQPYTRAHRAAFNRISAKHLDFVLCDRTELTPVAAIELDDSSHQRRDRVHRDELVDGACADAGLPLVRERARGRYDPEKIRDNVQAALSGGSQPEPAERSYEQDTAEADLDIAPEHGGVETPISIRDTSDITAANDRSASVACRQCGTRSGLEPHYSRERGYYVTCPDCQHDTPMRAPCPNCASDGARIERKAMRFTLQCRDCGYSKVVFDGSCLEYGGADHTERV